LTKLIYETFLKHLVGSQKFVFRLLQEKSVEEFRVQFCVHYVHKLG